jgi:hypothetical protein
MELPVRRLPGLPEVWPLPLYGRYEIREILTAVGWLTESRRTPHQSGILAIDDVKIELLFVTLYKTEVCHDRTAYGDHAISPEIFHWQTQNNARPATRGHIEGGRPMSLHWTLEVRLPMELFRAFSVLRA